MEAVQLENFNPRPCVRGDLEFKSSGVKGKEFKNTNQADTDIKFRREL